MKDEHFMKIAIKDAKKYGLHFGAVVVKDKKIIAKAGKRTQGDARFHAESQTILKATKKLKSQFLDGCTLYSTCEPCPMCFYLAWITHIKKIVYGSCLEDSIKSGFQEIGVTVEELNKRSGNKIELKKQCLREECLELLKI